MLQEDTDNCTFNEAMAWSIHNAKTFLTINKLTLLATYCTLIKPDQLCHHSGVPCGDNLSPSAGGASHPLAPLASQRTWLQRTVSRFCGEYTWMPLFSSLWWVDSSSGPPAISPLFLCCRITRCWQYPILLPFPCLHDLLASNINHLLCQSHMTKGSNSHQMASYLSCSTSSKR